LHVAQDFLGGDEIQQEIVLTTTQQNEALSSMMFRTPK
jgi:hypothetical protein